MHEKKMARNVMTMTSILVLASLEVMTTTVMKMSAMANDWVFVKH